MAQEIADSKLIDTWSSSGLIVKPDISKIIEGWQLGEQPPHEYMNWLQNTFGSKLNHILKNGVASWNNTTQYLAGSSVQHNGNIWLCKTTNTNSAPTDANANWKRIITVEALTTVLNGYVKNTGDETIAGVKTFSSTIAGNINGNAASATTLSSRGGFPDANGQDFNALTTTGVYYVQSGNYSGILNSPGGYGTLFVNNAHPFVSQLYIDTTNGNIRGRVSSNSVWSAWSEYVATTGNQTIAGVKTFSSTISGSISGNAATVTNGVYITGNQTIAGVKTFSSSPIVPTPTTGTQAVNKDYADLKVALAQFTGANQSLSANGYQKLPGDLIIQWGTVSVPTGASVTANLPIAFPVGPFICLTSHKGSLADVNTVGVATKTQITVAHNRISTGGAIVDYLAIGY